MDAENTLADNKLQSKNSQLVSQNLYSAYALIVENKGGIYI
jgi:hypothetical protein